MALIYEYTKRFDPDCEEACVVYYDTDDVYITLSFIEEDDETLRFEDEDEDEPMMSVYATVYAINHVAMKIEEVDGFCYRIRNDQTLGEWFKANDIDTPDWMFDLEALEENHGITIEDFWEHDFHTLI